MFELEFEDPFSDDLEVLLFERAIPPGHRVRFRPDLVRAGRDPLLRAIPAPRYLDSRGAGPP